MKHQTDRQGKPGQTTGHHYRLLKLNSALWNHYISFMDANTIIAAKAGVMDFTKALCNVMALSGIRVNCIVPGVIETDMNEELSDYDRQLIGEQTSLGTIGLPDHIAQAALFLAQNQFIAGEILNVNGLDDYTAGELDEGIGDVGWLPLGNPEPLT